MAVSTRCLVSQWASGSTEGNGWWPVEQKTDLFESLTNSVSLFFARTATTSIQELNVVRIFSKRKNVLLYNEKCWDVKSRNGR